MVNASTGAAFGGGVTVYVTIDAGTQAIGSVGGGVCTAEGNGYYTYRPSQAETNGALIGYTFIGSGAVPVTVQVATVSANQQTALGATTGSGATIVSNLLIAAMRRINVIQENEFPSPAMLMDAFDRFNDWVDSVCANDRLLIFAVQRALWTITSTKGTLANPYTVGLGGDININRPMFVTNVRYQNLAVTPTLELPLAQLTEDAWERVPQKDLTGTLPTSYRYNPTFTGSGFGSLYLWMVPTQSNLQGVLYYPAQVTRFNTVNDTIALPPGYNRFLRDNLAVELAAEFRENIPLDPGLVMSARESKEKLKMVNLQLSDLYLDNAVLPTRAGQYNIYSDGWSRQ
jgi:hypothetical protein